MYIHMLIQLLVVVSNNDFIEADAFFKKRCFIIKLLIENIDFLYIYLLLKVIVEGMLINKLHFIKSTLSHILSQ